MQPHGEGLSSYMQFAEPSTMVTDFVLATVAAAGAIRLLTRYDGRVVTLWSAGLLSFAVAALLGGVWHGVRMMAPEVLVVAIWRGSMVMIGCGGILLLLTIARAQLHGAARRILMWIAVLYFAAYLVWTLSGNDNFRFAVYFYVPILFVMLVVQLWVLGRGDVAAPWIIAGLVASIGAGLMLVLQVNPHRYFNQDDIYHLVQALGMVCFYRAGVKLAASPVT